MNDGYSFDGGHTVFPKRVYGARRDLEERPMRSIRQITVEVKVDVAAIVRALAVFVFLLT